MKTMKKTAALAALLAMSALASAKDVYVYPTGIYTPVLHMQEMQCITFGEEGIEVTDVNGSSQSVSYENFDYFRFYPTPDPTGIQAISQKAGRKGIYSLTGVYMGEGESTSRNLPAGIYLVREKDGGRECVKKIMIK